MFSADLDPVIPGSFSSPTLHAKSLLEMRLRAANVPRSKL
jgi:hypothetical protein